MTRRPKYTTRVKAAKFLHCHLSSLCKTLDVPNSKINVRVKLTTLAEVFHADLDWIADADRGLDYAVTLDEASAFLGLHKTHFRNHMKGILTPVARLGAGVRLSAVKVGLFHPDLIETPAAMSPQESADLIRERVSIGIRDGRADGSAATEEAKASPSVCHVGQP